MEADVNFLVVLLGHFKDSLDEGGPLVFEDQIPIQVLVLLGFRRSGSDCGGRFLHFKCFRYLIEKFSF